jgi:uncharacterized protein
VTPASGVPQRLSLLVIGAADLAALRAFYRRWGWIDDGGSGATHAAFRLGTTWMYLYPVELLAAEAGRGGTTREHVVFSIGVERREQVDEVFDHATVEGAGVVAEPTDRSWGGRSAYVADPEGNRWEILWAPDTSPWAKELRDRG